MVLPLGVVGVRLTGIGQLAVTLKQPTDKSGLSNAHHINEQMFDRKEARRKACRTPNLPRWHFELQVI
jgi:hypothetical protein